MPIHYAYNVRKGEFHSNSSKTHYQQEYNRYCTHLTHYQVTNAQIYHLWTADSNKTHTMNIERPFVSLLCYESILQICNEEVLIS